jgi:hypothetical protein
MNEQQGTSRLIATTADLHPVYVIGMGEAPRPRQTAAPTGEATFGTGCLVKEIAKDGSLRTDKQSSVAVLRPLATYEEGKRYRAQGRVWVNKYPKDGWMTQSVICDALVPVDAEPASDAREGGGVK